MADSSSVQLELPSCVLLAGTVGTAWTVKGEQESAQKTFRLSRVPGASV